MSIVLKATFTSSDDAFSTACHSFFEKSIHLNLVMHVPHVRLEFFRFPFPQTLEQRPHFEFGTDEPNRIPAIPLRPELVDAQMTQLFDEKKTTTKKQ